MRTSDDLGALSPERLEAFAVFAEHRSFTRGAQALSISQPALHTQIRRISEELDVELYQRRGRRLELTEEGIELLRFARSTLERSRRFVDRLRGAPTSGVTILAAGEGALLYLLGPAIRRFQSRSAPLRLLTRDREGTFTALREGAAHLGVAALDAVPDGFRADPLVATRQVLLLPKGHRLIRRRSITLADLDGERIVLPPVGRPQRATVEHALRTRGVGWKVSVEATGWPLTIHAVALGLGVGIVNEHCTVPRSLHKRPLRELPEVRYALLYVADGPRPGGPAELAQIIRESASELKSR